MGRSILGSVRAISGPNRARISGRCQTSALSAMHVDLARLEERRDTAGGANTVSVPIDADEDDHGWYRSHSASPELWLPLDHAQSPENTECATALAQARVRAAAAIIKGTRQGHPLSRWPKHMEWTQRQMLEADDLTRLLPGAAPSISHHTSSDMTILQHVLLLHEHWVQLCCDCVRGGTKK